MFEVLVTCNDCGKQLKQVKFDSIVNMVQVIVSPCGCARPDSNENPRYIEIQKQVSLLLRSQCWAVEKILAMSEEIEKIKHQIEPRKPQCQATFKCPCQNRVNEKCHSQS